LKDKPYFCLVLSCERLFANRQVGVLGEASIIRHPTTRLQEAPEGPDRPILGFW